MQACSDLKWPDLKGFDLICGLTSLNLLCPDFSWLDLTFPELTWGGLIWPFWPDRTDRTTRYLTQPDLSCPNFAWPDRLGSDHRRPDLIWPDFVQTSKHKREEKSDWLSPNCTSGCGRRKGSQFDWFVSVVSIEYAKHWFFYTTMCL